ncbi:hypothetical protein BaRGS_00039052 [Batillaria attramentaria]|uniref:Uncharacterized protein n=1 Tax=Batillaria attramentaria TaxID=370345 RepID=A0ABD0J4B1_9CAEN
MTLYNQRLVGTSSRAHYRSVQLQPSSVKVSLSVSILFSDKPPISHTALSNPHGARRDCSRLLKRSIFSPDRPSVPQEVLHCRDRGVFISSTNGRPIRLAQSHGGPAGAVLVAAAGDRPVTTEGGSPFGGKAGKEANLGSVTGAGAAIVQRV